MSVYLRDLINRIKEITMFKNWKSVDTDPANSVIEEDMQDIARAATELTVIQGLGQRSARKLKAMGIKTVGDLANANPKDIELYAHIQMIAAKALIGKAKHYMETGE